MSHPIRTVTIGELCREGGGDVQTGPFGSQLKASAYVPIGIPTIMPANLIDYRVVDEGIARIGPEDHARLSRHHLRPGDIVYGRRGDIGRHALVTDRESGWLCGTGCLRIRFGDAAVHPAYASYYLRQPQVIELILGLAVGTTMPNLNTSILESIPLDLPPLPVQQRIAEILGRLDDKIEANRRINRTLEQMAQALYKHWFVDFGPFQDGEFVESELGLIPKGWGVKALSSQVELLSGGTPSTRIEEYWNGEIDWVAASDVSSGQPFIMATERTITPLGVERSSTKLLPAFTTIITARGTVGECGLLSREMAMNQTNYGVRGRDSLGEFRTYLLIDNVVENLRKHAYGTVFDTITRKTFDGVQVIAPPPNVLSDFEGKVNGFFHLMLNNQMQERKLAAIRDYLLPRLLSGGLAVG